MILPVTLNVLVHLKTQSMFYWTQILNKRKDTLIEHYRGGTVVGRKMARNESRNNENPDAPWGPEPAREAWKAEIRIMLIKGERTDIQFV